MVVRKKANNELKDLLFAFNINKKIIDTCLNRQVPSNNAYWANKDNYVDFSVRFLSIPFWLEICFRLNVVSEERLLSESYLSIMEEILHFSEQEELGLITHEECILKCLSIYEIKSKLELNVKIADDINYLIHNYPKYKSLRRGNFLIYYSILLSDKLETIISTSKILIDLIICGCVIDDLHDVYEDSLNSEDNIIIELGNDSDALNKAKEIFDISKTKLIKIFPELDIYFNKVLLQSLLIYVTKSNEKTI